MKAVSQIKKVAVLGAGTMGPGIAFTYAAAGFDVCLYSRTEGTLSKAKSVLLGIADTFSEMQVMARQDAQAAINRITYTTAVSEAVDSAQLLVETIKEDIVAKQTIYAQADEFAPPEAIFASNTSELDIFSLMPERRKAKAVITHWFMPPHIVPLVEIVQGPETDSETISLIKALTTFIGKTPVFMPKYSYGFIINRIQRAAYQECMYLVDHGFATPEDIDIAVKTSMMPRASLMGIFQTKDFNGLYMIDYENDPNLSPILKEKIAKGELGAQSGIGWYDYHGTSPEELYQRRDRELIRIFKFCEPYAKNFFD